MKPWYQTEASNPSTYTLQTGLWNEYSRICPRTPDSCSISFQFLYDYVRLIISSFSQTFLVHSHLYVCHFGLCNFDNLPLTPKNDRLFAQFLNISFYGASLYAWSRFRTRRRLWILLRCTCLNLYHGLILIWNTRLSKLQSSSKKCKIRTCLEDSKPSMNHQPFPRVQVKSRVWGQSNLNYYRLKDTFV